MKMITSIILFLIGGGLVQDIPVLRSITVGPGQESIMLPWPTATDTVTLLIPCGEHDVRLNLFYR